MKRNMRASGTLLPSILIVCTLEASLLATSAGSIPNRLLCEWNVRPLNVERPAPRLSWRSGVVKHLAYQIQVASSHELLAADTPDLWDSGKVDSAVSLNIPYAGKRLTSRQMCHWRVRVWADKGAAAEQELILE